jgi:hypothetical protein
VLMLVVLYIASTLLGCCSDGRFEDFPGDFDEF